MDLFQFWISAICVGIGCLIAIALIRANGRIETEGEDENRRR